MWETAFAQHVLDPSVRDLDKNLEDWRRAVREDKSAAEDVLAGLLMGNNDPISEREEEMDEGIIN